MAPTLNWFFFLFVCLYLLHLMVGAVLDVLNLRESRKNRDQIPALFKDTFSEEAYKKSIAYTTAKTKFGWAQTAFGMILLWGIILTSTFYHLDQVLSSWIPRGTLLHQVGYLVILSAIFYVLELPFKLYLQFRLEEKFGFNKMTYGLFIKDQIKTIFISAVLGVPLVALIFYLVSKIGGLWWLAAWGVLMAFQVLIAAIFPVILAPLFYKFTPLEEGELKEKILGLTQKIKFKMAGVFTIDGSKRSTHSNAFFAGLGKTRRIALFDTLRAKLNIAEIIAVLAHEMGHQIKKHVLKGLILSSVSTLVGLYVLSYCLKWPLFFEGFGIPYTSVEIGFVLFGLVSSVFTFPFTPLSNYISRRHEYEADRFSVETTNDKNSMSDSLIKLSRDNLSNLTPHPWYSFFHYSHPTTLERHQAIERI